MLLRGVDVRSLPLRALRAAVAVLPQSPFVATASLRHNLDPGAAEPEDQAAGDRAGGQGRDQGRDSGRGSRAGAQVRMGTAGRLGSGTAKPQERERLSDGQLVEALRWVGLWAALEAAAAHRHGRGGGGTGGGHGAGSVASGSCAAGDMKAASPAAVGSVDPTTVHEVLSLPLGSQPGAVGLSAGQQQLLALARVLLRPRQLLLLDECSAHVDPATAAAVRSIVRQHVLRRAGQGSGSGAGEGRGGVEGVVGPGACAVLEVAHDLGAVVECDEVAVMEGGRVLERGPPGELLGRSGGAFRRLYAAGGTRNKKEAVVTRNVS